MNIMSQTAAVASANVRNPTAWLALAASIFTGLSALLQGSGLDEILSPLAWKLTLFGLNAAALISTTVRQFARSAADDGQNSGA
jgi:hypothetical protein